MSFLDQPELLRQQVAMHRQRGVQTAKKAEVERQVEEANKSAKIKDQAAEFLGLLPRAIEEAATKRQRYCIVMHMTYGDSFFVAAQGNKLNPDQLRGASALVWDACVKAGLMPELRFWHDGGGMEGGFDLVIPV